MIKVKYPAGKVHLAFGIYFGGASVICNRVPIWHKQFEIMPSDEPITCPTCIRKGGK